MFPRPKNSTGIRLARPPTQVTASIPSAIPSAASQTDVAVFAHLANANKVDLKADPHPSAPASAAAPARRGSTPVRGRFAAATAATRPPLFVPRPAQQQQQQQLPTVQYDDEEDGEDAGFDELDADADFEPEVLSLPPRPQPRPLVNRRLSTPVFADSRPNPVWQPPASHGSRPVSRFAQCVQQALGQPQVSQQPQQHRQPQHQPAWHHAQQQHAAAMAPRTGPPSRLHPRSSPFPPPPPAAARFARFAAPESPAPPRAPPAPPAPPTLQFAQWQHVAEDGGLLVNEPADPAQAHEHAVTERMLEIQRLLLELKTMESQGYKLSRTFTEADPPGLLRFEIESQKHMTSNNMLANTVKTGLLVILRTGEYVNTKFGPFVPIQNLGDDIEKALTANPHVLDQLVRHMWRKKEASPVMAVILLFGGVILSNIIATMKQRSQNGAQDRQQNGSTGFGLNPSQAPVSVPPAPAPHHNAAASLPFAPPPPPLPPAAPEFATPATPASLSTPMPMPALRRRVSTSLLMSRHAPVSALATPTMSAMSATPATADSMLRHMNVMSHTPAQDKFPVSAPAPAATAAPDTVAAKTSTKHASPAVLSLHTPLQPIPARRTFVPPPTVIEEPEQLHQQYATSEAGDSTQSQYDDHDDHDNHDDGDGDGHEHYMATTSATPPHPHPHHPMYSNANMAFA